MFNKSIDHFTVLLIKENMSGLWGKKKWILQCLIQEASEILLLHKSREKTKSNEIASNSEDGGRITIRY